MSKYEDKKKRSQPVSFYPPKPVYEELRKLAFDERNSMNALLLEAVDLLFKKRGIKSVKKLTEEGEKE